MNERTSEGNPKANAQERFKKFLGKNNLRVTNQRLAIFEAAYSVKDHFTAEDLLTFSRKIDTSVSRATVYRTLPILVESETVREVDVGKDYKYYTVNLHQKTFQAQVICVSCDKIFEIDAPFMEWYGKTVAEKLGLEVVSQRLQVTAKADPEDPACICQNNRSPQEMIGAGSHS